MKPRCRRPVARPRAPATGARPDVVASGRARGVHAALRRARPGQLPFSLSLSLFIVGLGRTPLRSHSSLDLVEHSCSHTHRWTWIEHSCSHTHRWTWIEHSCSHTHRWTWIKHSCSHTLRWTWSNMGGLSVEIMKSH